MHEFCEHIVQRVYILSRQMSDNNRCSLFDAQKSNIILCHASSSLQ